MHAFRWLLSLFSLPGSCTCSNQSLVFVKVAYTIFQSSHIDSIVLIRWKPGFGVVNGDSFHLHQDHFVFM